MSEQDTIAVIGAGVIGSAVAYALAREGRRVLLVDRADPGVAGASFGNVGHIAAELVQPLPSPALLFGFWRELCRFGGSLDLPARQVARMLPWLGHFALAAFRRDENTRALAPLVLPAAATWARWLDEIGRPELLKRHGHYEVGLDRRSQVQLHTQARTLARLGVRTERVAAQDLLPLQRSAGASAAQGFWYPDSANVLDPLEIVRALARAALDSGAKLQRMDVQSLQPVDGGIEVRGGTARFTAGAAVVCAGVDSAPLLAPFRLRAPLQAVRGYHIELPGQAPFFDAPVVYVAEQLLITPMAGRLRASSYMEFAASDAPADPQKPLHLRHKLRALGYACETLGPSWMGSRPVLPDYLPAIGRAPGASRLFYATGHQHIGLTIAPISAELVADLVAERTPALPVAAFDLRRFGHA